MLYRAAIYKVYHEIQARLILDDYPSLVRDMVDLVDQPNIEPHLLRQNAVVILLGLVEGRKRRFFS